VRDGTAGIQNLVKTHEGKGSCIAAKAKLDKVRGQRKNGSMMHFFSKAAKPASAVIRRAPVQRTQKHI
jgi:hypothetical protein